MLTSLTSSCLWSSDVPWESWLVFLDRHASISQAKGTVNLPWKQAPLSKLLQLRQSVLCLHFLLMLQHCGWKSFHPCSLVLSDPSRLLSSSVVCASASTWPALTLQSCAPHYMHVNNFSLKSVEGFWGGLAGVSSWMAGLVPSSPQQPSLFKVVKNQLCHILQKENIPYLDPNAVIYPKTPHVKKNLQPSVWWTVKIISRLQDDTLNATDQQLSVTEALRYIHHFTNQFFKLLLSSFLLDLSVIIFVTFLTCSVTFSCKKKEKRIQTHPQAGFMIHFSIICTFTSGLTSAKQQIRDSLWIL